MGLYGAQRGRTFAFRASQRLKWTARAALAILALMLIRGQPATHLFNLLAGQSDNRAKAIFLFAARPWHVGQMAVPVAIERRLSVYRHNPATCLATWLMQDTQQNGIDTGEIIVAINPDLF